MQIKLQKILPVLDWGKGYDGHTLAQDLIAAVIVTVMLIPQSLAYALLAGLPPEVGLYASILPLLLYAIFGTSRTLAVGPVAVLSLMTASAAGAIATQGTSDYIAAALILAILSGLFLLLMGIFRLGFFSNFLSHPVIAGFITATGLIIAASQVKHIFGIKAEGHNLYDIILSLFQNITDFNPATLIIGSISIMLLFWIRSGLKPVLINLGLSEFSAGIISRAGPMFTVIGGVTIVAFFRLDQQGVQIVGNIPTGLPSLSVPKFDWDIWYSLAGSAALISLVGFVESISVAQTLAAKRRERIDPNQELIGLGVSSLGAGISGGYPVTGGFARSAVNFDAGARTPAAGAFTAIGIAIATLSLTPLLYFLPKAVLAATIIIAVISLVDVAILKRTWVYSKADFAAVCTTIIMTLIFGVEIGISSGVLLSILLFLYRTSKPHIAEVGLIPETEHFRNIKRHKVKTCRNVLILRIDESLYFANARNLEEFIYDRVVAECTLKHVVLMCSAVNEIDSSALESLEAINHRLNSMGIKLHLSEVKGPVMDRLNKTEFLSELSGNIFLSQYQAYSNLDQDESAFRSN